jgi:hypothetical protein
MFELKNLKNQPRTIGRAAVFIAVGMVADVLKPKRWDGATNLQLRHLCDTEGVTGLDPNESFVYLQTPETTGAGKHAGFVEGEDPVVEIPAYNADPELAALISGTGNASAGTSRRRRVKEHTLVLIPEELLLDEDTETYKSLGYDGEAWTLDGTPLTPRQQLLLAQSRWVWRGHFVKPRVEFKHDEAGKAIGQARFQVMLDFDKPEGEMLYTVGDPAPKGIDIMPEAGA